MTEEEKAKMNALEEDVAFYKLKHVEAEKGRTEWILRHNEESILKTKYKMAFDVLYDKVAGK